MKQMKMLSDKQLSLISTLEGMQSSYQLQMNEMNQRISNLENMAGVNNNNNNSPNRNRKKQMNSNVSRNNQNRENMDELESPRDTNYSPYASKKKLNKSNFYDASDKYWVEINNKLKVMLLLIIISGSLF